MCERDEQLLEDLKEFLNMLDFKKVSDDEICIIENYFKIKDLPASIQVYLEKYFNYTDSIQ